MTDIVHTPEGHTVPNVFTRDMLDWLPWHHTFGGNHNLGLVLYNGGTLYMDDGRPVPGRYEESLRNLREIHRAARDVERLAAVQQRLVILLPGDWDERRELALLLADLGRHRAAADELALYLQHAPDARDAARLQRQLTAWRRLQ
jgi:acyl-CoA synthetase (AMP-forming)/AMP-acid ligase II